MGLTPTTQVRTLTCCRCRLCVWTLKNMWTIKRSAGVVLSMPLTSNAWIAHKLPQLSVRLKQLARKLTVHVSMQGMSSAGQKRSPPNELERQVSTDQAAVEYAWFAAFCYWPCAESMVKLKTNSQPWLAGLPFPGRGGQAAESNTVCQHSHIQIAMSWITDWKHNWQGNWSRESTLPDAYANDLATR